MTSAAERTSEPDSSNRRRSSRRKGTDTRRRIIVRSIGGLAALLAAFAGCEPTGWIVSDVLLAAGFAYVVTVASARAQRWTWLWLAGIATAAGMGSIWVIAAALALGICAVAITTALRDRIYGAAIGALAVQTLLRLPDIGFTGFTALLTALAVAPALWSGYSYTHKRTRRQIHLAVGIAAGAMALATLVFGLVALNARSDVEAAIDTSRQALDTLQSGDQETAGALFDQAAGQFDDANAALTAPWALPARLVPAVGHHAQALGDVTAAGENLAATASTTATTAPYQQLRASAGQIDLTTVASMQEPVDASVAALEDARRTVDDVSSPWLLPRVADPLDELAAEIDDSLPDARLAAEGLRVAPDLLGGNGTRRYLLLVGNPAEARYLGGFVGAYGELEAQDGKVTLTRSGPIAELAEADGKESRALDGPAAFVDNYGSFNPARYPQNLTAAPDFPLVAEAARQLYPQTGGSSVDGVIYVDPYGLEALLALTGPITVEGITQPLTAENAADYLLRQQYTDPAFATDVERQDALTEASRLTFEALTGRDLPAPADIADALSPAVAGGRLAFITFDETNNAFLTRLGTLDHFVEGEGDYFSVHTSNLNGNKIDAFLQRNIDYAATYDPASGSISAEAIITLENTAPADGLPDYVIGNSNGDQRGTNRMSVAFYSPLRIGQATLDGQPIDVAARQEFGGWAYTATVVVPPGSSRSLELRLSGAIEPSTTYRLGVGHQAGVDADGLDLTVKLADGWQVSEGEGMAIDGSTATATTIVDRPLIFTLTASR